MLKTVFLGSRYSKGSSTEKGRGELQAARGLGWKLEIFNVSFERISFINTSAANSYAAARRDAARGSHGSNAQERDGFC